MEPTVQRPSFKGECLKKGINYRGSKGLCVLWCIKMKLKSPLFAVVVTFALSACSDKPVVLPAEETPVGPTSHEEVPVSSPEQGDDKEPDKVEEPSFEVDEFASDIVHSLEQNSLYQTEQVGVLSKELQQGKPAYVVDCDQHFVDYDIENCFKAIKALVDAKKQGLLPSNPLYGGISKINVSVRPFSFRSRMSFQGGGFELHAPPSLNSQQWSELIKTHLQSTRQLSDALIERQVALEEKYGVPINIPGDMEEFDVERGITLLENILSLDEEFRKENGDVSFKESLGGKSFEEIQLANNDKNCFELRGYWVVGINVASTPKDGYLFLLSQSNQDISVATPFQLDLLESVMTSQQVENHFEKQTLNYRSYLGALSNAEDVINQVEGLLNEVNVFCELDPTARAYLLFDNHVSIKQCYQQLLMLKWQLERLEINDLVVDGIRIVGSTFAKGIDGQEILNIPASMHYKAMSKLLLENTPNGRKRQVQESSSAEFFGAIP